MLRHLLESMLRNPRWDRREFLKNTSAAMLAALAAGSVRPSWASDDDDKEREHLQPTADAVILLWMAGGMAHTETFDPKESIPYRKGIRYNLIPCTFGSIPTAVDGVRFSEGLENLASVMDRICLIRSFQPPDLGHILHSRHQYHWHTGYVPPQSIAAPHIGSMISRTLGRRHPDMPSFVHIGQRLDLDGSPEVKAFLTPSFLGHEHGPLNIPHPEKAHRIMSPPENMTPSRFENRQNFYRKLAAQTPVAEFGSGYQRESLERAMESSYRLITSPIAKSFDLSLEEKDVYESYNTSRFGRGCLLARRLVENGARFVEVSTEHVPFGNWDTHNTGHDRTIEMKRWIDRPIAQLVLDLEKRGLLDRTLIVLASEFSRTATREPRKVNPQSPQYIVADKRQYGLHKHFTQAGSVLLIGGGAKPGFVYGKSADEVPCQTVEDPVTLTDLHATIYRMLGIHADFSYEVEKRPFYVTEDGLGKPVPALLA